MQQKAQQVEELKNQGNACVKSGNYGEAVLHYSHGIKLEPGNHLLYSNRSLAFLKLQQYYLALEDAKQSIKLQPNWPKGFFRKGEVEYQSGNCTLAIMSYKQALLLDPSNSEIQDALDRAKREAVKLRKELSREPWIFSAIGFVIGLCIVLADQYLTKEPSLKYIFAQLILMVVFGGGGFLCWKGYRYLQDSQRTTLLEAPVDLMEELDTKNEEETNTDKTPGNRPWKKGGIGAARQRYKQGKS
ncbi:hypothetical protein CHS0354_010473 [Potamilus streckersoni]|uniref:Stress-induced-phosphoprotein 1 n=1 Tax=Potamilus streckersoni TaxID=2493646 RepID=A0AAE0RRG2_9BIVA|nr:hypothetical protein CHS0354_010473 [Potamilus streckersoni]